MALQAKLNLRQSQSLVMTPQLLQSIRLLQFSHAELQHFIDGEIERNPLLERGEPENAEVPGDPAHDDGMDSAPDWDSEAIAARLDTSLDNIFPDDPGLREPVAPDLSAQWKSAGGPLASAAAPAPYDLEDIAAACVTLRGHVEEQVAWSFADPAERLVARELAGEMDDNGYLRCSLREVAERLGTGIRTIEAVLARCQLFDPPGLFARDLAECLSLQLRALDRLDPAMLALIGHLDLLAKRDFRALTRICGVGEDDLIDMLAEIRALDPHPGAAFSVGPAEPIIPDVTVRPAPDGGWTVELNSAALPSVLVDQTYLAAVTAKTAGEDERRFLSDCIQSANWLTRSLDQRARTILKVATEIVRQQDAFLVEGVRKLKPLILRTVAENIGMHESTVSRVTANKFMMTPRGVFELRYFFTAAIASADDDGDAHSAEAVRDRIRGLIEGEGAGSVLSDDAVVDILRKSGIDIARRTVAKYRDGMSIPSSVQRRREKKAAARTSA